MSTAFNRQPGIQHNTVTVSAVGESYDSSEPKVLSDALITRLQVLFPSGTDLHEALKIMQEQRLAFDDDAADAHNYNLFMGDYSLDEIYQYGEGDVSGSMKRIYGHFATWYIDEQVRHQADPPQLEVVPQTEALATATTELGKEAARLTVAVDDKNMTIPSTGENASDVYLAKEQPSININNKPKRRPMRIGDSALDLMQDNTIVMPEYYLAIDDDEAPWQERALCAQADPEAFFPEKGGSTREAKRICSGCEVKDECLDYAISHDERFGIWGGLSERERRRLKRGII
jgi:WhiB family transcriptional regulator, redox-sensing transcriptional regulator